MISQSGLYFSIFTIMGSCRIDVIQQIAMLEF